MLLPPPLALAAETNAAANKPASVSSLRMIDRGGAGAVLQALADNNASSCVAVQPDPGDASDTLVAWGERRRGDACLQGRACRRVAGMRGRACWARRA